MPKVASTKTRGTARPTKPAVAVPLSAIAAPGAMIAMESATASQNRSPRLSPPPPRHRDGERAPPPDPKLAPQPAAFTPLRPFRHPTASPVSWAGPPGRIRRILEHPYEADDSCGTRPPPRGRGT